MEKERVQDGAAMIEFSIVIALILFAVSGLVDLGYQLRIQDILIEATRYGGRTAAALSDSSRQCPQINSTTKTCGQPDYEDIKGDIERSAVESVCSFVETSGLTPQDWEVQFSRETVEINANSTKNTVDIVRTDLAQSNPDTRNCIFCVINGMKEKILHESSTYVLACN